LAHELCKYQEDHYNREKNKAVAEENANQKNLIDSLSRRLNLLLPYNLASVKVKMGDNNDDQCE